MNLEDLMVAAVLASGVTLLVLMVTAYRDPIARAFRRLVDLARRVRPWQVFAVAFGTILLYTLMNRHAYQDGYFALAIVGAVVVGFTVLWAREFGFLMNLRDDNLPGRFDKPIWAALLVVLPPIGLVLFRSHRLAHWPEPEPKPRMTAAGELA